MKLLRETIRRMIIESVCDQTNNKIHQAISELESRRFKVKLNKSPSGFVIRIFSDSQEVAYLDAHMTWRHDDLPCRGAFIIGYTEVKSPYRGNSGFGALIYDIALELAGTAGLASDRDTVSGDAVSMWRYLYSSGDYDKKPFDTADGEFTPADPSDICRAPAGALQISPTK